MHVHSEQSYSEIGFEESEIITFLENNGIQTDSTPVADIPEEQLPDRSHLDFYKKSKGLTPFDIGCLLDGTDPQEDFNNNFEDPLSFKARWLYNELIGGFGTESALKDYAHKGWNSGLNDHDVENQKIAIPDLIQWLQARDFTDNGFIEWLTGTPLPTTNSEQQKLTTKQQEQIQHLEDQLLDASTFRERMERQIDGLTLESSSLQNDVEQLTNQLQAMTAEREQLKTQLDSTTKNASTTKKINTHDRRCLFLAGFAAARADDKGEIVGFSQGEYWELMGKSNSDLFQVASPETVKDFFKKQSIVKFKRGPKPKNTP
jgi:hypothetical protein